MPDTYCFRTCGCDGSMLAKVCSTRASCIRCRTNRREAKANDESIGRWHHHECMLKDRRHKGDCVVPKV